MWQNSGSSLLSPTTPQSSHWQSENITCKHRTGSQNYSNILSQLSVFEDCFLTAWWMPQDSFKVAFLRLLKTAWCIFEYGFLAAWWMLITDNRQRSSFIVFLSNQKPVKFISNFQTPTTIPKVYLDWFLDPTHSLSDAGIDLLSWEIQHGLPLFSIWKIWSQWLTRQRISGSNCHTIESTLRELREQVKHLSKKD